MASKRNSEQEGDERGGTGAVQIPVRDSKRRREEDSQESDTQRIRSFWSLGHLKINDIVPCITNMIRGLVREELDDKLPSSSICSSGPVERTTINEVGTSGSKFLELVFNKELHDPIFTHSKIEGVEIALHDTRTQSIVTDGPLSSMKIEICALYGDFDSEDWSTEEFDANIVTPRENKGRLLKGEMVIRLENGVGYIPIFVITDNTSWIRCRHFRLGAKVLPSNLNYANNIREGRSNKFTVLDARGESNLKNRAPSLNDEICRLRHISKKGKTYERLLSFNIRTVKDLLQEHETDPSSLQKKFGNISKKYREEIIAHAKEAKNAETTTCVAEAIFEGKSYRSEKNIVNSDERDTLFYHRQEAHRKLKDPMPIETIKQVPMKTLTQELDDFPIALQEGIMDPRNLSALCQYGPVSQFDQMIASFFTQPDISPSLFQFGDAAESSNNIHCSFPNPD